MKGGHRFRKTYIVNTWLNKLLSSTLVTATRSRKKTAIYSGSPVITSYLNHGPSPLVRTHYPGFSSFCFSFVTQMCSLTLKFSIAV